MTEINEKKWGAVALPDVFDKIQRGQRHKNADHIPGSVPYISSSEKNNGVDDFVKIGHKTRTFQDCISLANSGSVGTAFYEPFLFVASDHVTSLKRKSATKFLYLFLLSVIEKQKTNFNFNREINDLRIRKLQILLPVDDDGNPDYAYMAQYASEMRKQSLTRYKNYIAEQISRLEYKEIPELGEKEWQAKPIIEMFERLTPGKGKGLNHLNQTERGINYIGATNRNNGVLCTVEDTADSHKLIQPGNCIGFIKNGDGAAGFAIYKKEPFISTSDVVYGYAKWLNLYTGLFFVAAQDMIEKKYSHGYKRNLPHLRGDKVMLPVNGKGEPDYAYMEQYAKNLILKKCHQYLTYLEKQGL